MATVTDYLGKIIQQVFVPTVQFYSPKTSPTWEEFVHNRKDAYRENIGLDWKVVWSFGMGMAGAVEAGSVTGPNIASTPATPTPPGFQQLQDVETWPGMSESILPTWNQHTLTLKRIKVDFFVPAEILQLAQLRACIGKPFEEIIRGTAKNFVRWLCNAWYAQKGNSLMNSIGSFTASGGTISSSGLACTLDTAGTSTAVPNSFAKITPGMRVDLYADNSNTRLNPFPIFIDRVKGLNRTATYPGQFYLYSLQGSLTLPSDVIHIVPRNSGREAGLNNLPTAFDSFFNDGTVDFGGGTGYSGGYDTSIYTWLQSLLITDATVPTEPNIIKTLAELEMYGGAYDEDSLPDTFLMTPGVMARFFQDYQLLKQAPPGAVDLSGGVKSKINYELYGKTYEFRAERWLPQKHAYLTKLHDNWETIRPPLLPGAKSGAGFDPSLQFLASVWSQGGGPGSIFLPAYVTGGPVAGAFTKMGHAPAECIMDILPRNFGGWVKWSNMTESYLS